MKHKQISTTITTYQQISTNSRARSVPLPPLRPNVSYMRCASYKYINGVASASTSNMNKFCQVGTNINKYKQIS